MRVWSQLQLRFELCLQVVDGGLLQIQVSDVEDGKTSIEN